MLLPILWQRPWAKVSSQRVCRTQGGVPGSYYWPSDGACGHRPLGRGSAAQKGCGRGAAIRPLAGTVGSAL